MAEPHNVSYRITAVRDRRISAGISGMSMARAMGINIPTYYKKEAGLIKWSLDESKFLADFFGTTIDALFFGSKIA